MKEIKRIKAKFEEPENEYTPFPFWFWNGNLEEREIERQIRAFFEKGIRGFIIHPRIGIPKEIEYLSDTFFKYVSFAVELAEKMGMKVILYDEAMYPSGAAHGEVVKKNPDFASKGIKLIASTEFKKNSTHFQKILFAYQVEQDKGNIKKNLKEVPLGSKAENIYYLVHEDSLGTIRGIHFGEDDGEANAPRSADLLDAEACRLFVKLTHDRYYEKLGPHFGKTIIGFFTDEPAILGRNFQRGMLAYNQYVEKKLTQSGVSVKDLVYLFVPEASTIAEEIKRKYNDVVYDLLASSYYRTLSDWCETHQIFLTGHPHESDDIGLLKYFQVPGQDVVWRWIGPENNLGLSGVDATMGKCSSDAARHMGRRRNGNECFGCCGYAGKQWSFSTDDMKWYLDWLFVRGVNTLYLHAFFYSLEGKRIEDRAPDVGMNNLWWDHYEEFVNYMKRMSYMLTDSINQTNVAILAEKDRLPHEGIESFYQQQIEFNYLEDTILFEAKYSVQKNKLLVKNQAYEILIIDRMYPHSEKIKKVLSNFAAAGGQLVFSTPDEDLSVAAEKVRQIYNRPIELISNFSADLRYSHIVKENTAFHVLSNEGEENQKVTVKVPKDIASVELWDPWTGADKKFAVKNQEISFDLNRRSLMILYLSTQKTTNQETYPLVENLELLESDIQVTADHPDITGLGSWTTIDQLKYYSGNITYQLKIHLPDTIEEPMNKVFLDLGKVKNIATLRVNGQERKTIFWSPYVFELSLAELKNDLVEIVVTNTLTNRIDKNPLESGLIGPIAIKKQRPKIV